MLTGLLHCHGIDLLVPGLFHQLVYHAATSGIRDTIHHPYIFTCFEGNILYPFIFDHAK